MRTLKLPSPLWRGASALAMLSLAACTSPDTEAELDEFRASALGRDTGMVDTGPVQCADERPAIDGEYLCALSATIGRDKPIYLYIDMDLDGDTITANAQPLVRDTTEEGDGLMENRRTPAGDALPEITATYESDGSFELEWIDVTMVGEANPITFREIGGDFVLSGTFVTDDVAFGDLGGMITNPTTLPLNGSTFACERTEDPLSVDPVYYNSDILDITPCATDG